MRKTFKKIIRLALAFSVTACAPFAVPAAFAAEVTAGTGANSADRVIFWVKAAEVSNLSDEQLDLWKSRGVDGFVCANQQLYGMGGTQKFTGDPNADLGAQGYELQRAFRDSRVVARAKSRGMKMYLGFYLVNYYNTQTPLKNWFDDAGWRDEVLPRVRELAAAARLLGFDGLAFDQELYPQVGGTSAARWNWNFPGNTHAEAEVRAKAKQRGRELMQAILEAFPQVEIVAYDTQLPETWLAFVQKRVNNIEDYAADLLFLDFWDGLTSVEGYGAIRFVNSLFYKTPHLGTWETAFQYEFNTHHALLSRRFSNWAYASSRVFDSPFSWIDGNVAGEGAFTAPRPPDYVAAQLAAFRKWGMGGEFANFCYAGLGGFDYAPYIGAIQAASTPSVVDYQPPRVNVTSPARVAYLETTKDVLDLEGFATDNLAIRFVRWKNERGGEGAAVMRWRVNTGDYRTGYEWQMDWSARGVSLKPGENRITVTAEDIKGLTASQTLTVWEADAGPAPAPPPPPAQDPSLAPVLLTEEGTERALALDSVTWTLDPFPPGTSQNFSADGRTRLTLFALNVELAPGEGADAVTAQAEDALHRTYPLAVEFVGKVPTHPWLTQLVVRLPDAPADVETLWIGIGLHGRDSNKALIGVTPAAPR